MRSVFGLIVLLLIFVGQVTAISAQARISVTPVAAVLVTPTPEGVQQLPPTVTQAPSPTPLPAARLQALESAGSVNVRILPDLESELLGQIAYGSEYAVLRNYYKWYELSYDLSPNGRAWVYEDLVSIVGDRSIIEVIDTFEAIVDPADSAIIAGGEEGGAADGRTIEIAAVQNDAGQGVEFLAATPLPTFTAPAVTQSSPIQQRDVRQRSQPTRTNIPPLVPIMVLAGLGLFGILISILRGG